MSDKGTLLSQIAKAAIVILFGSTTTALLNNEDIKFWKLLRNWMAGITGGCVVLIIVSFSSLDAFWQLLIVGVFSSFISTVWPLIKKKAIKRIDSDL